MNFRSWPATKIVERVALLHGLRAGPFGVQRGNERLVRLAQGAQCIEQRDAARRPQRMDHQVAPLVARDADPVGVQPELRRDAHRLAVAVVEDTGDERFLEASKF